MYCVVSGKCCSSGSVHGLCSSTKELKDTSSRCVAFSHKVETLGNDLPYYTCRIYRECDEIEVGTPDVSDWITYLFEKNYPITFQKPTETTDNKR